MWNWAGVTSDPAATNTSSSNPVGWTPTLEPLWRWNGDEIFICGWDGMNYENPKRQWMWNRRCQSTKWLYIIKNCGCRKLICFCFFLCFGCVLSVCRFIVFDFCSSIELHYWVGVVDGAILQLILLGSWMQMWIPEMRVDWCCRFGESKRWWSRNYNNGMLVLMSTEWPKAFFFGNCCMFLWAYYVSSEGRMPFCVFEFFSKYMCSVALCALGKE